MSEIVLRLLVKLFVLVAILPLHEFAHGWMAKKMGDRTAQMLGRLTLNPIKHLDYIGALCMLVVGFGWAKPVPINPENFKWKNKKLATALVAFAGPASNLIAAFVGCFIWELLTFAPFSIEVFETLSIVFSCFVSINIGLAIFNLLPIPPLDGSKILYIFLPDRWIYQIESYSQYIMLGLFALMYLTNIDSFIWLVGDIVFRWMIGIINAFLGLFV
ncbi:MAG: site-2 protease family protein [Clostridia bacterium]|nr:site-2 protease family protein [Clostridia bacterium]